MGFNLFGARESVARWDAWLAVLDEVREGGIKKNCLPNCCDLSGEIESGECVRGYRGAGAFVRPRGISMAVLGGF